MKHVDDGGERLRPLLGPKKYCMCVPHGDDIKVSANNVIYSIGLYDFFFAARTCCAYVCKVRESIVKFKLIIHYM